MLWSIICAFDKVAMIIQSTCALHQAENCENAVIERGFANLASFYGLHQFFPSIPCRPGHFEIKPCIHTFRCGVRAKPIGHDDAIIAPILAQYGGEQPVVF